MAVKYPVIFHTLNLIGGRSLAHHIPHPRQDRSGPSIFWSFCSLFLFSLFSFFSFFARSLRVISSPLSFISLLRSSFLSSLTLYTPSRHILRIFYHLAFSGCSRIPSLFCGLLGHTLLSHPRFFSSTSPPLYSFLLYIPPPFLLLTIFPFWLSPSISCYYYFNYLISCLIIDYLSLVRRAYCRFRRIVRGDSRPPPRTESIDHRTIKGKPTFLTLTDHDFFFYFSPPFFTESSYHS